MGVLSPFSYAIICYKGQQKTVDKTGKYVIIHSKDKRRV